MSSNTPNAEMIAFEASASASADIALLIYGDTGLATIHPIYNCHAEGPSISPGRLLASTDLATLASILEGRSKVQPSYVLPEHVLAAGEDFLTWYAPPVKRRMHFFVNGQDPVSPSVIWPGLIFHACRRELYLVAYDGSTRPGPSTNISHAPLMNIDDSSRMCRGSAVYPTSFDLDTIPGWEHAVFGSAFTHTNHDNTIAGRGRCDDAHLAFWTHPARARHPVSARHLAPLCFARTCQEWLEAIHDPDLCLDED